MEVQDGARTAWGHPCPYLLACVLSSPRLCVPPWMGFGGSQHRQLRGRPEDGTHWTPGGPTGPEEVGSTLLVFACFQCQSPELGVVFPGMCRSLAFHLPSVCPGWALQLHTRGWEGRSGGPRALPSAQDCLQGIRNVLRTHRNVASTLIDQGQLRSSWERALPAEAQGPGSFLTCPGLGESLTSNHIEERGRERGMPRGGAGGGITPALSLSLSPRPHLTSGEAGVEEKGPPEHLEGLAPAGVWGG